MAKQASRMAARHGGIQPRTWARGVVTTHSYNGWNGLTNTAMAEVRADAYGYNARNELISGTKSGGSQSPATEYEYSYSLEEILVELANKLPDGRLAIPNPIYNFGFGDKNPDIEKIEKVRERLKICISEAKKCSAS